MTLTFFLALFLNTDVWGLMKMYWNTKQFKGLGPTSAKSRGPNLNFSISRLLCILTSFWVLGAPESWSNYFFSAVFNLSCSFQTISKDFTPEINKKNLKKNKKKNGFCLLPHKKGWKRLKKVVRPNFVCVQHPKAGRNTQHPILFYKLWCDRSHFLFEN